MMVVQVIALAALVLQEVKASRGTGTGMGMSAGNAEDEKNWRLKASQIKMQAENEKAAAEKREEKLTAAIKGAQKENEDLKQRLEKAKTDAAQLERKAAEHKTSFLGLVPKKAKNGRRRVPISTNGY